MSAPALDTTHQVPTDQIRANGIKAVGGYAPSTADLRADWKTLVPAWAHLLHSLGLGVWWCMETTANMARRLGYNGGRLLCRIMCAYLDMLGVARSVLATWTIDEDDPLAAVIDFARGWNDEALTHGRGSGCYCGDALGEQLVAAGLIVAYWRTGSSSFDHGVAPTHADILQHATGAVIADTDADTIVNERTRMIWWPTAFVPPKPAWHVLPFPGECVPGADPHVVAVWKFLMLIANYGRFNHATEVDLETCGSATQDEIRRLQRDHDVFLLTVCHETDMSRYFRPEGARDASDYTGIGGEATWLWLNLVIAEAKG